MRRNSMPRGNRSGNGPLRTDHLKLQDLDLELELLKRKREMIEHQQQVLVGNTQFNDLRQRQFEYGFDQPRPAYQGQQQQYNSTQNFSRYYNDPPAQQSNNYVSGMLGKRPGNKSEWQDHSTPKRFSGPQGGAKKKFGAGSKPAQLPPLMGQSVSNSSSRFSQNDKPYMRSHQPWDQPPALMGPKPGPRRPFISQNAKKPRNDFKPTKVSKKKQTPSASFANKLISYPIPQLKKMVEETTKAKVVQKSDKKSEDAFTLRPDVVPTQQLVGRLELALGQILKEMKAKFEGSDLIEGNFSSPFLLRKMKQSIRERLRGVMMNKHVGKVSVVVEKYRAVFPPATDVEIVQYAMESQKTLKKHFNIRLVNADTPENYFKINMNKLVGFVLEDMFGKIEKLYENVPIDNLKEAFMDALEKTDESITEDFSEDIGVDEKKVDKKKVIESNEKEDALNEKIETNENETKTEENAEVKEEIKVDEDVNKSVEIEGKQETVSQEDEKETLDISVCDKDEKPTEMEVISLENDNADKKDESSDEDYITKKLERFDSAIVAILKNRLPHILPRYKSHIVQILNLNDMYKTTAAKINLKLREKLSVENRVNQAAAANGNDITPDVQYVDSSEPSPVKTPVKPKPPTTYYVKILGRPGLPKRKVMQTFLQQYNPKTIKKHRHMHLLFVGFGKKEDFDKIVAVKEIELGNVTISIRVSEKSNKNDFFNDSTAEKNAQNKDAAPLDETNNDTSLGSELDDQINDLLSSIRTEEEKNHDDNEVIEVKDADAEKEDAPGQETTLNAVETSDKADEKEIENENVQELTDADMANGKTADANVSENDNDLNASEECKDKVEALKNDTKESGRATPTRASSRLSNITPSTIRTRRASRLAQ